MRPATSSGFPSREIGICGRILPSSTSLGMAVTIFVPIYPGDIVFTGTPEGVSPIASGDRIVAIVERIGTMEVDVRDLEAAAPHALGGLAAGG